jgi:pectate lyase
VEGKITASGLYTAPANAGTDTVTATSDADSSKKGTATIVVTTPPKPSALAAFPGAQGGGAASAGGRGGVVMEVTNTHDSGDGSLRDCVSASGARTCVFRVAGIFTPQSQLRVNDPFLTIACQTAPGEVIIGGPNTAQDTLFIATHDVTVRYCTFSADNPSVAAGPDTGTMNIEIADGDNYNIILDHVTTRWAGNKLWATVSNFVGPNRLITIQWSMFYEPHAGHPVGPSTATSPFCTATSGGPCFSPQYVCRHSSPHSRNHQCFHSFRE